MPEPLAELARTALIEITPESTIGPEVARVDEGDGAVTIQFETTMPGYPGWRWNVTVATVPDADPTVVETELLPADGALLAPDWVPWSERLADWKAAQEASADADAAPTDSDAGESDDDTEDSEDDDLEDDLDDDELDADDESDEDDDEPTIVHGGDVDGVDIDELDDSATDEFDESEEPDDAVLDGTVELEDGMELDDLVVLDGPIESDGTETEDRP
jgi:hypothetical protein